MLIPRKIKHRKQHHPGRAGAASGGLKVTFGQFGIQALTSAYVTNRQIEAARIAMTRHIKEAVESGSTFIPIVRLQNLPKPAWAPEKDHPEWWVANVKPGRVLLR